MATIWPSGLSRNVRYAGLMRWAWLSLALLAGALSCGHGQAGKPAAHPGEAGDGAATTAGPAGGAGSDGGALTEVECDQLLDHYIAVATAELPADQRPTGDQVAAIRARMKGDAKTSCVGQARGPYDCAMKATTREAIEACFPHEGPTGDSQ